MGISHSFPAQVAVYAGRLASTYAAAVASAFDASYPAAPGAAAAGLRPRRNATRATRAWSVPDLGRKRVRNSQLWRLLSRSFSTRFG